jgi:galactokinase
MPTVASNRKFKNNKNVSATTNYLKREAESTEAALGVGTDHRNKLWAVSNKIFHTLDVFS